MKKKHLLQLIIGVVISTVALYFVFKDVRLTDLVQAFQNFEYVWLLPSLGIFYLAVWLRAVRWRLLFLPRHNVSLKNSTAGIFICFAFNSVFPARLGEFARAYLINKQHETGFSKAVGTVVSERLLDMLAMLGAWVVVFLFAKTALIAPGTEMSLDVLGNTYILRGAQFLALAQKVVILAVVLIILIVLLSIDASRNFFLKIVHAMTFLPEKIRHGMENMLHRFAEGLESFKKPRLFLYSMFLSVIIWVMTALSFWFLAKGFAFEQIMTVSQSITLMVIVCIFIMLPAAPGYWGFFEAGTIFGLVIMGIHDNDSLVRSYAILIHIVQWLPIVLVGLPWAWVAHVSMDNVEEIESAQESATTG